MAVLSKIFTSPSRPTLHLLHNFFSLTLFDFKGNRPNSALISAAASSSAASSSSQNQLEEYVDILQVQQLLLENSTASSSSSSTVNTASYTSPASSATTSSAIASKNLQSRPRVNLQKAAEFAQVQGKHQIGWILKLNCSVLEAPPSCEQKLEIYCINATDGKFV